MWGQSFRPNYRRIVNLVTLLTRNFPVLATTATATLRVQADIIEQVGIDLIPVRGRLLRPNIGLFVVQVQSEDEKFFWLAEYLPKLARPGIIYTGTQANTDIFSNWLQFIGFKSSAYSGRLDAETRKHVEEEFINNRYDCVVSTNALGMGIDKPDIRFIIHTQVPQSPIHYYQEIGRSGRDGKKAFAILLFNSKEDLELPKSFIEGSKPSTDKYERMIDYTGIKTCRMKYLCNYLGDEQHDDCGICDNDRNKSTKISATDAFKERLHEFRETFFPVLEVEIQKCHMINGVAASYYGVSNVGTALHHSKYIRGGDFPDWLLELTLKAFRKHFGNGKFDLILSVPPTESGDLVKTFAEKISAVLEIPISYKLEKQEGALPQKILKSAISKRDNVKGKFVYSKPEEISGKKILLVDDIIDSGYTVKEIGHYLTGLGAEIIAPLVIARTVGGDI